MTKFNQELRLLTSLLSLTAIAGSAQPAPPNPPMKTSWPCRLRS